MGHPVVCEHDTGELRPGVLLAGHNQATYAYLTENGEKRELKMKTIGIDSGKVHFIKGGKYV